MASSKKNDLPIVRPRTPAEAIVAALYGSLLGVDNVGIHDSFFALGGNSRLTSQLLHRLHEIFHVTLSLSDILDSPTIDRLVTITSQRWGGREIVDEIAWTFTQVEQLSEREVSLMLQEKRLATASSEPYQDDGVEMSAGSLSADKRRLFELLLEQTGISMTQEGPILPRGESDLE